MSMLEWFVRVLGTFKFNALFKVFKAIRFKIEQKAGSGGAAHFKLEMADFLLSLLPLVPFGNHKSFAKQTIVDHRCTSWTY